MNHDIVETFCLVYSQSLATTHVCCREELVNLYNVSLKFVSTQSGLTRWLHFWKHTKSEEGDL
jgi:hypothetical protein